MKINKSLVLAGGIGLVFGALIILGERAVTYRPAEKVHYHANFAIYINGQREQFKDIFYYIDTGTACGAGQKMTPYERAHLHDNVNDVVHVEDEAVTWGQFFQNIGWVIDSKLVRTPDQLLLADSGNRLTFMLNGEQTDKVINSVIGDKDRLLVDFGSTDSQTLQKEFESVASTAGKYNGSKDVGSCGGASEENSWSNRMRHMF